MNELATQSANGTNSTTDRSAIQDEISQLTTEIDRVAETTKFNETYLLKGGDGTKQEYMKGHDAGLKGTLTDGATTATFKVAAGALDAGKSVTIGGKDYTIGTDKTEVQTAVDGLTAEGDQVTVNGKHILILKKVVQVKLMKAGLKEQLQLREVHLHMVKKMQLIH